MLQLIADSKFLQLESLVELVKAIVHAAGPLQHLSATPESMENAEVNVNTCGSTCAARILIDWIVSLG